MSRATRVTSMWAGLWVLAVSPAAAQDSIYGGQERQFADHWSDWPNSYSATTIRERGQPLIPVFEGWYPNPDGTFGLSFGYFNMNSEETFYVPIGPDNFLEPAQYNGMQPTFFMPALPRSREGEQRHYRHESVFTVNVPGDFTGDLVWTLRYKGMTVKVPGRVRNSAYGIENLQAMTSAPEAPGIRVDASGPEGRGQEGPVAGPRTARVGAPLPLSAWVRPLTGQPHLAFWFSHQGPAAVVFSPQQGRVEGEGGEFPTTATFSEPGEYMVRVTALQSLAAMVQHCCYSNAYVKVTVTP